MIQPEKNTLETILVVEDQPIVLEVVREILERAGFCVLTTGSGAEAIQVESITQGTIHLLLSDVMMPDRDSLEVLANNDLGEPIYGTPAPVGSALYIRSAHHLWAFAKN